MKKNDAFSYDVSRNEQITIEVTPKNFRDNLFSVRAQRDGKVFPRRPNTENAPVFQFTVSKSEGDIHTVTLEFNFIQGTPQNSLYEVSISGEDDQGCPCGFTIKKTTASKDPDIEFNVV